MHSSAVAMDKPWFRVLGHSDVLLRHIILPTLAAFTLRYTAFAAYADGTAPCLLPARAHVATSILYPSTSLDGRRLFLETSRRHSVPTATYRVSRTPSHWRASPLTTWRIHRRVRALPTARTRAVATAMLRGSCRRQWAQFCAPASGYLWAVCA